VISSTETVDDSFMEEDNVRMAFIGNPFSHQAVFPMTSQLTNRGRGTEFSIAPLQ
jgi:hypothetical protein